MLLLVIVMYWKATYLELYLRVAILIDPELDQDNPSDSYEEIGTRM